MVYLRSGGLYSFIIGISLILVTQLCWLGSNLWIADWSSDRQTINSTAKPPKSLELRLGIYGLIGFAQGEQRFLA